MTDSKGAEESKDPDTCHVFSLRKLFATLNNRRSWPHSIGRELGYTPSGTVRGG